MFMRADFEAALFDAHEVDGLENLAEESMTSPASSRSETMSSRLRTARSVMDLRFRGECGLRRTFA
jgi:hypothetical protein